MADPSAQSVRDPKADSAPRGKLLWRIGLAAALIALLIGGLALYDASVRPSRAPRVAQGEVPPGRSAVAELQPEAKERSEAVTAGAPTAPMQADEQRTGAEPRAEPERTTAPEVASSGATAGNAPARAPHAAGAGGRDTLTLAPAPKAEKPAPATPSGGYLVQAGVFSDPNNAQELQSRLVQAGIPYQVEMRVQAGPFGSRKEALAAREKLKDLGIKSPVLIPPKR